MEQSPLLNSQTVEVIAIAQGAAKGEIKWRDKGNVRVVLASNITENYYQGGIVGRTSRLITLVKDKN
ncbi:hypothetical protein [Colwellia hornerae]|uniref:Uncharacterized protein n=1 Tax=Colwellia hornerae TaxID=89402 RepID=A0ABY3HF88_9GAMM|nr:hypothetical protein [Colwellia hornerae]TWX62107.1 hypothetical protein ESZ26_03805 [Colwellia hornerae]